MKIEDLKTMTQDDLNKWAAEPGETNATFEHISISVTDDALNAPSICEGLVDWLQGEGKTLASLMTQQEANGLFGDKVIAHDEELDDGYLSFFNVFPYVDPGDFALLIEERVKKTGARISVTAHAKIPGKDKDIYLVR